MRLPEDRTTLSLSDDADRIVRELVGAGWFVTEIAAFQAAIAVAMANGLSIDRSELRGSTTKFNVGTLDPQVRELVLQFHPGAQRPYELANHLAEAGLRHLGAALDDDLELSTALGLTEPNADSASDGG